MEIANLSAERFTAALREWSEVFMRRSMHDYLRFAKSSGLSITQLSALYRLYHHGACGVSEIGEHLGVTNPAASQMVDRLFQQGYLERTEDSHDRRVKHIDLTARGRGIVEDSIEARWRWTEALPSTLTDQEQMAIVTSLITLTEAARSLERKDQAQVRMI